MVTIPYSLYDIMSEPSKGRIKVIQRLNSKYKYCLFGYQFDFETFLVDKLFQGGYCCIQLCIARL